MHEPKKVKDLKHKNVSQKYNFDFLSYYFKFHCTKL